VLLKAAAGKCHETPVAEREDERGMHIRHRRDMLELKESGDFYSPEDIAIAIDIAKESRDGEEGAKEIKEEPKEVKQEIKQEIKEESWDDYSPQDGKEAAEMSGDRD